MQAKYWMRAQARVWIACALAVPSAAQSMTNQHVSTAGVQANAGLGFSQTGYVPCVSDDGRYVAFASGATNLVAGDTNAAIDVFVHDNTTGATLLISRTSAGAPANATSLIPSIASTGRFIVYWTAATNIVTSGAGQILRHDRDTDVDGIFDEPGATSTLIVSVSTGGAVANGTTDPFASAVSDSGDVIAFTSSATNLVAGDTNGVLDCFVRTISTGVTRRVSVSSAGTQGDGLCSFSAISGNGGWVVFNSWATNLVTGDTNATQDVFVHELATGVTTRVSVRNNGLQTSFGGDGYGAISDDGARIAFSSGGSNLVSGDTNGTLDIFVRDRVAGTTTRASVGAGGVQANGGSYWSHISGDGNVVVFSSSATNLAGSDTNGAPDLFAHRFSTNETALVSRAADDTPANDESQWARANPNGEFVAFISRATNLVPSDTNGAIDVFLRGAPFTSAPIGSTEDTSVTFSVNGPVGPHTEGIRDARGAPATPQAPPLQAGNPMGYCIRDPAVPQADGIDTLFPGDVFDYDAIGLPSEAVMFQSPPFLPVPPDGINQQILETVAMGLLAGFGLPPPMWTELPPLVPERDNVDAFSFGEDYFPDAVEVDYDPSFGLPIPPPPAATAWSLRTSVYAEPIVTDDPPGIVFRFSNDPWAIGLPGTDLSIESGGFDAGAACGPWSSDFEAAGDVFGTPFAPLLTRVGGVTVGGGANLLIHDNPALALAPLVPPLAPMEDDLDALECVGDNTSPWFGGVALRPGDLHARMIEALPADPAPAGSSIHEVSPDAPVFFSVTRNSAGEPFSAVRSQFVLDGGASADIYVATDVLDSDGFGENLLFIDEAELGLYAEDLSPGGTDPLDLTDDLDALILRVCPEYRYVVSDAIREILGLAPPFTQGGWFPWMNVGFGDARDGGGMTISITKYLTLTGRPIPMKCIKVGFSVTTDSIGLEFTGVDWEAGPVFPIGGPSQAPADVFYAQPDGDPINENWLWYEEVDLGQDAGTWINGTSTDLSELSDNLNALDSICDLQQGVTHNYCPGHTSSGGCAPTLTSSGNPSASGATSFVLTAGALPGGTTGLIFYGTCGTASTPWGTTSALCVANPFQRTGSANAGGLVGQCNGAISLDWNAYVATHPTALGVPFGEFNTVWSQCWYRDPASTKTTNMTSALRFTFGP